MAHQLEGFIGRHSSFRAALTSFQSARVVWLPQAFALLPLSDSFVVEVTEHFGNARQLAHPEFLALTPALSLLGNELSLLTPTAYIETEYFGGHGSQGSIVWDLGRIVLGPLRTGELRDWEFSPLIDVPLHEGAINQALRYLGVIRAHGTDEFSALELGSRRSDDEWLATLAP
jgi:hypothetical protein